MFNNLFVHLAKQLSILDTENLLIYSLPLSYLKIYPFLEIVFFFTEQMIANSQLQENSLGFKS